MWTEKIEDMPLKYMLVYEKDCFFFILITTSISPYYIIRLKDAFKIIKSGEKYKIIVEDRVGAVHA